MATFFLFKAFKTAAACSFALTVIFGNALARAGEPLAPPPKNNAEIEYYWEAPNFAGPPKGLFQDEEIQKHYERFLWADTMKAREVWARKKEDITELPFPNKLSMIGNFRKHLKQIEKLRYMTLEGNNSHDRMNRGLSPNQRPDDMKWEI